MVIKGMPDIPRKRRDIGLWLDMRQSTADFAIIRTVSDTQANTRAAASRFHRRFAFQQRNLPHAEQSLIQVIRYFSAFEG